MGERVPVFALKCAGIILYAGIAHRPDLSARQRVQDSPICGPVLSLTCAGSHREARLLVTVPGGESHWELVIPQLLRQDITSRLGELPTGRTVCLKRGADGSPLPRYLALRHAEDLIVADDVQLLADVDGRKVFTTCDSSVRPPVPVREVRPSYPHEDMRARVAGTVLLHAIVNETGEVLDIRVVRSLSSGLDAEVQKAFAQWRFVPATRMGIPVAVAVTGEFHFRLQ